MLHRRGVVAGYSWELVMGRMTPTETAGGAVSST